MMAHSSNTCEGCAGSNRDRVHKKPTGIGSSMLRDTVAMVIGADSKSIEVSAAIGQNGCDNKTRDDLCTCSARSSTAHEKKGHDTALPALTGSVAQTGQKEALQGRGQSYKNNKTRIAPLASVDVKLDSDTKPV